MGVQTPTPALTTPGTPAAPDSQATVGDKLYPDKTPERALIGPKKTAEEVALEAKAAEDKLAADKLIADKDKKPEDKKSDAPITYDALKMPEGVIVDDKALATAKEVFTKFNLPPEAAQALVDMHFGQLKALNEAAEVANSKLWTDTQAEWRTQLDKDPELGGDKKAATTVRLGQALDEFGSKEAREAFDLTGAGNNPHIVRFINKMAMALQEGGPVPNGGVPGKAGASLGDRLYGGKN